MDGKKTKKQKKTSAKHIGIRLLPEGGCIKMAVVVVIGLLAVA